jgi:hypothetical protein
MRVTIRDIQRMKDKGERIPMLTAYDYTTAQMIDAAGIPMILVGDSLGMVVLGYSSTVPVTLDDIIHHTKPVVASGRPLAFVADELVYLSTECPSSTVQEYTLLRRKQDGTTEELLQGRTIGGIGEVVSASDSLLMDRIDRPAPGVRGPQAAPSNNARGSLWIVSADSSARRELYEAPVPLFNIRVGSP